MSLTERNFRCFMKLLFYGLDMRAINNYENFLEEFSFSFEFTRQYEYVVIVETMETMILDIYELRRIALRCPPPRTIKKAKGVGTKPSD